MSNILLTTFAFDIVSPSDYHFCHKTNLHPSSMDIYSRFKNKVITQKIWCEIIELWSYIVLNKLIWDWIRIYYYYCLFRFVAYLGSISFLHHKSTFIILCFLLCTFILFQKYLNFVHSSILFLILNFCLKNKIRKGKT